ncbi:uncharacterized protein [Physcomitrium patens]|uniref:Pre-mRNA-splicing factor SYF1 n=1 Tax=Physcomitrium patens TaxID=3218 RepID=A9SYX9_PHYPA|nr:pre-mRNA-splicing factor SYF1-like [Physcomitrium patens]PNR62048.1 hypothetical protein PHYPA_000472 [Physcomitrium patens]|eukprot:XP_024384058.1 pre-mRNA-splicing factor SYF1-like [Physcomitrella patens]
MVAVELYPSQEDLFYEEEILRNPYSLKLWWRYVKARSDAPAKKRHVLYERAVRALPGSYKLWHAYLKEKVDGVRGLSLLHPRYEDLNNTFERALVTMHKMPRLWIMYLQTLTEQKLLTRTRRTFDRALCALAVTQHDRIWEIYLNFVSQQGVPVETSLRVYRRFLKYDPTHVEDFIEFLQMSELWQEAAERLAQVLNDETFYSRQGKTRHQLWLSLCKLLTTHTKDVSGLQADAIIRGGIRRFTNEVGRLWTSLADYYIRCGLFEKARDVFEEGVMSVVTVRDFSIVFDAYSQFEESILAAKMEQSTLDTDDRQEEEGDESTQDPHRLVSFEKWIEKSFWLNEENDVDLRLARLENLMERRPELVSSVLLRQNPHNVHEWHKRVKLFANNPSKQVLTFTEAVRTVDAMKAVGRPHTLWVAFAKLYESHADVVNARVIFEKAVMVNYKAVDDLAIVWCEWAEMELRHKNLKGALDLMQRSTAEPSVAIKRKVAELGEEPVQLKLHKSLRLWEFYVDLEEGLGTLDSTRKIYERIFDLRIITPKIVLNYAALLEDNKFFEDAFKVYERGVQVFKYPHVRPIWSMYLNKFVSRYGGKKLERARDLFEQALKEVPEADAKPLYLQYAKLEEDHGLARHALAVYERATKAVEEHEKLSIYDIYIARAAEFFGLPRTREIYEHAIESGLPDKDVKTMCIKYAELERNLGEIDRARAIYVHASQSADPRSDTEFWSKWNDFEVQHGNEDTFREMLRIKRSVTASYSQMHFILPEYLMQRETGKVSMEEAVDALAGAGISRDDGMAALEKEMASSAGKDGMKALGFVSAGVQSQTDGGAGLERDRKDANDEEIGLEDEEEEEDAGVDVAEKSVPDSVFGNLAQVKHAGESNEKGEKREFADAEPLGAKERFKRQKKTVD